MNAINAGISGTIASQWFKRLWNGARINGNMGVNMPKIPIEEFFQWCVGADEYQLVGAKAKLLKEKWLATKMIDAVDKRLEYLDSITPENCTKRANSLIIEPPIESD
jgi:hypothetical protein